MSLHAELTPEAQARLKAQQRNSTISSIVISFLVIVLLGLILAFIFLEPLFRESPTIVSYSAAVSDDDQIEQKKMTNSVQRKPSAPASSAAKVIASNTISPTAIPVPDVDIPEPTTEFGDGDDFGDGWGSAGDSGEGGGFGAIPATMRKRCSTEDRMQRLLENGGTPACEEAVVKALDWMQQNQNEDGSWGNSNQGAMTGLAVLAYLGHCETPLSPKYGDTVLRGITWLVDLGMQKNGIMITSAQPNPQPYEHAIATYALGESSTFCKQLNLNVPNLHEVTQKAGQYILDNQHGASGGWDYGFRTSGGRGGDLSIVAWKLQALKACYHTGMDFNGMKPAIRKALEYVEARQASNGGFGYTGQSPAGGREYFTLTGAGMLSLQMWDKGNSRPVRDGAEYIRKNSKLEYDSREHSDLYAHYYESQAMINRGGEDWKFYNEMFRDQLLNAQNDDGSFKAPGDTAHRQNDVFYRTALCTLMLETYYRFLPGTGAGIK